MSELPSGHLEEPIDNKPTPQPSPEAALEHPVQPTPEKKKAKERSPALQAFLTVAHSRLQTDGRRFTFDGGVEADQFNLQAGVFELVEAVESENKTVDVHTVIAIEAYDPSSHLPKEQQVWAEGRRQVIKVTILKYQGIPPIDGQEGKDFEPLAVINVDMRGIQMEDMIDPQRNFGVNMSLLSPAMNTRDWAENIMNGLENQLMEPEQDIIGGELINPNDKESQGLLTTLAKQISQAPFNPDLTHRHTAAYLDKRKQEAVNAGRQQANFQEVSLG